MNYKLFYKECTSLFLNHRWNHPGLEVSFIHNDRGGRVGVSYYEQYAIVDEEKATAIKLRYPDIKFHLIEE